MTDSTNFDHSTPATIGVLLTNLGTPAEPTPGGIRRFLKEFLGDPRVVELPRWLWWLVLNGVILNTRPRRKAKDYAEIWGEDGSPLMTISVRQTEALQASLSKLPVTVELAMRYGSPAIADGLSRLKRSGATRILVLPLYPQYSATTTASTFDAVAAALKSERWLPEIRFINHYHDDDAYIDALADSVRGHRSGHGVPDLLLMSFHGIPREYFDKGDPYFCECQKTARLLAEKLGLAEHEWQVSFQSRLGPKQWLEPYTDETLRRLAGNGVRSVQVICPGFSTDCLETLEEIAMQNRDTFLEAGGERFEYIPCLNDTPAHIRMMRQLVLRHIQGWPTETGNPEITKQRAMSLGATA